MNLVTIQGAINAEFASYTPTIIARQDAYLNDPAKGKGIFFQGLSTHTDPNIPANVLSDPSVMRTAPDNLTAKPSDQGSGWTPTDFPATMPCALLIDTYNEGATVGYFCALSFRYEGDLYMMAVDLNDGSSSYNWGWRKVDGELVP